MKRIGNVYEKTFSMDGLVAGYLSARRGKRRKLACWRFERNLGANLHDLHEELMSGVYAPRPYYTFIVTEPKERVIQAPRFRDCVVQHAAFATINPIFEPTFIHDSYACRVGRGTHAASNRLQQFMRRSDPESYYLEMDIRKFFPSINHDVMNRLLARKIKDQRLLDLLAMFRSEGGRGMPIGFLLSQIKANICLNEVDHFCKRDLGVKQYLRYMDNFACIGLTRERCLRILEAVREFIATRLDLGLSKFIIQKIRKGFNFVGYRTWRGKRFIRKRSLYNFSAAMRRGNLESIVSIMAHAKNTRTLRYLFNMIMEQRHELYLQIPKRLRRLHYLPRQSA